MKSEKLLQMIYLLLGHERLSATALGQRLGVSVRTVYRYVETLSIAGIPVYTTQGRHGGIALLPEFQVNKALLTKKEQTDILAALQSLQTLNVGERGVVDKLAGIFKQTPVSWLVIDPTAWRQDATQQTSLRLLRGAILQSQFVQFDYLNAKNEEAHRWVYPYHVVFKNHAWYLHGYAYERRAVRLFKLTRVQRLTLAPTPTDTAAPWRQQRDIPLTAQQTIHVQLWVDQRVKYRLYEEFPASAIQETATGDFQITSDLNDDEWLLTYLLSFGHRLRVLAPQRLRQRLKTELEKTLANY